MPGASKLAPGSNPSVLTEEMSDMDAQKPAVNARLSLEMMLDALRATAQEGLSYTGNEYDRARYKKLLDMASEEYAAITGLDAELIREVFLKEHGSITPKVGVDIAIRNHNGEILLLQLPNGQWCLPGGWMDVGEFSFRHRGARNARRNRT
jgi:hypothetical protein